MRRNVIGAPLPTGVLVAVQARLEHNLRRIESVIAWLRAVAGGALFLLLLSRPGTSATSVYLLAAYTIYAVFAVRAGTLTVARVLVVADVIFVPLILLSAIETVSTIYVIIAATGFWIFLNALTGNVRLTRDRVAGYLALTTVAVVTSHASAVLFLVAVAACVVARTTARVQQFRLVGRTIESAERLQQRLARATRQAQVSN